MIGAKFGHKNYAKKALDEHIQVLSVDVFDTLLLRNTKSEFQRFYETGIIFCSYFDKQLSIQVRPDDLFWLRNEAARTAYRMRVKERGAREANIEEILSIMLRALEIEPEDKLIRELIELELEYEIKQLYANPQLVNTLKEGNERGKTIVCVSDMYLRGVHIEILINRHLETELVDKVFSSSDYHFGKSSGVLYTSVLEDFDVQPNQFLHCGDNYYSDVTIPETLGIAACYTPRDQLFRIRRRISHRSTLRSLNGI